MLEILSSFNSWAQVFVAIGAAVPVGISMYLISASAERRLPAAVQRLRAWVLRRRSEIRPRLLESRATKSADPAPKGMAGPALAQYLQLAYRISPWVSRWATANPQRISELRALGHLDAIDEASFLLMQLFFAAGGLLVGALFLLVLDGLGHALSLLQSTSLLFLSGAVGFLHPVSVIRSENQRLRASVARAFPSFLDGLALALESGQAFAPAFASAAERMAEGQGPWVQHLLRAAAELRAGRDRAETLGRLERVLAHRTVQQFASASITAERSGIGLASIFRDQAALARTLLHHEVERLAMQAPVKLLGPLMICIFPCTFLVLLSPLVAQLQASLLGTS